jgi:CHASE2 domain-containing sensor protein
MKKWISHIKQFIKDHLHEIFHHDHVFVVVLAWVIAGFWAILFVNFTIFDPVSRALSEFKMTDIYFTIQRMGNNVKWSDDIVLIDITEQRDRGEIAQTLQDLASCNPKTVLMDVIFEMEGEDLVANGELVSAIDQLPQSVLSCKLIASSEVQGKFVDVLKSFFEPFGDYTWAYSNVLKGNGPNGTLRDYTISQKVDTATYYSLPYLAACRYMEKEPSVEKNNKRTIVYSNIEFPVVRYDSIMENKALIKDKLVMVGTVTEEADMHFTPVGKMAGMKTVAYAAQTYIDHHEISSMSSIVSWILTVLVCLIAAYAGYLTRKYSPRFFIYWNKVVYMVISVVFAWIGFICFVKYDYDISLLLPLLGVAFIERGRIHYMWFIDYCTIHPQWKRLYAFASRSLYFKPPKKK